MLAQILLRVVPCCLTLFVAFFGHLIAHIVRAFAVFWSATTRMLTQGGPLASPLRPPCCPLSLTIRTAFPSNPLNLHAIS